MVEEGSVQIAEVFASLLQEPAVIVLFFVVSAYWFYSSIRDISQKGFLESIGSILFYFLVTIILPGLFVIFTEWLALSAAKNEIMPNVKVDGLRWLGIYGVSVPLTFLFTFRYSKLRTGMVVLAHLAILHLGWFFGRWGGIFLIATPILASFYYIAYELAQAIMPASIPEDKTEKLNKFRFFIWSILGLQYPLWHAKSSATRESEMRIPGKFIKPFGLPGVMCTYPHQVVVRSIGIELIKVDGPGVVFTGRSERPVTLVDLRTQLRPTFFNAVTSDGVKIGAVAFISFQIDRRDWREWERSKKHELWRAAPVLQNEMYVKENPFYSWPYAKARVQAALGESTINMDSNEDAIKEIHWDEVAVQRVIRQASLVLSERSFDRLWRPIQDNDRGVSAIDEMTGEIVKRARPELEKMGVNLFGARIVNFIINEETPIYRELLDKWLFKRDEEIRKINFQGRVRAEEILTRAKMRSRATFLRTVSNTLNEAQSINPNLLRHLTTMNFVSTLEDVLMNAERQDQDKQTARIAAWGNFFAHNEGMIDEQ